jgi:hypothetical protein
MQEGGAPAEAVDRRSAPGDGGCAFDTVTQGSADGSAEATALEADRPDRGQLRRRRVPLALGAILAAAQDLFDGTPIGRTASITSPMTGPRRRWASPASQSARNSGAPSIYHNSTQNSCGGPEIALLERHRKFVGTAKIGVEGSNGGMPRVQCRATVPVATICPAGWDFARGTVVIDGRRLSPFT